MSRRSLAKTAIEGGRTKSSKWNRRHSSQKERVNAKLALATLTAESYDEDDILLPRREKVYKEFDDKLNPVYRWLDSHVGCSWDKVRSKLFKQVDIRTTPGRHILYDHILQVVAEPGHHYQWSQYSIDSQGILRKKSPKRWWKHSVYNKVTPLRAQAKKLILQWMGDSRRVGMVGTKYYWYVPNRHNVDNVQMTWGRPIRYDVAGRIMMVENNDIYYWYEYKSSTGAVWYRSFSVSYRQDQELSNNDIKFLESLSPFWQERVLRTSPIHQDGSSKLWF